MVKKDREKTFFFKRSLKRNMAQFLINCTHLPPDEDLNCKER